MGGAGGEGEDAQLVQLPLSFPLTKPSHSRNHCMLMQYMTTGDSSSWNALFSYRAEGGNRGVGGEQRRQEGGETKGWRGGKRN